LPATTCNYLQLLGVNPGGFGAFARHSCTESGLGFSTVLARSPLKPEDATRKRRFGRDEPACAEATADRQDLQMKTILTLGLQPSAFIHFPRPLSPAHFQRTSA